MDKKTQSNKRKPKIVEVKGSGIRIFRFNLNTFGMIFVGILVFYIIASLLYQPNLGKPIEFSTFVEGIINNKFAKVDIRDDGQAIAYDKYVDMSTLGSGDSISKRDNTDQVNKFEEITIDQFVEKIKSPKGIKELIDSLMGGNSVFNVGKIVIGDNFVIVQKSKSQGGDLLIKDITGDKFKQDLIDRNLKIEDISSDVIYLKSVAKKSTISQIKIVNSKDKYSDIWVINNSIVALLKIDKIEKSVTTITTPLDGGILAYLQNRGFQIEKGTVEINSVLVQNIDVINLLTFLGFIILIGSMIFIFKGIQGSGNSLMKFGQSKAGIFFGKKPEVTFDDVAGVDEAKEELREIVMFLKQPRKFLKLGARIPKGLLLVGRPGTGKTLLAKAIAGEAGVPFFHTSGSEFEEMLVGAGASRVRDLFNKAKKASPSIIFIDEIDAVARKRGTTVQSSSTEQTLNQILVEMDGFRKNENLIVIGATNRPDVLDPAILRPGRFDRRVMLDLPDINGRVNIIKIHSKNKPLAEDVDLRKVAKRTVGFSGADIENMLNEAAIITAKADRSEITSHDIEEAATKVSIGPERRRKRDAYELKVTAYHESGHAIVARMTPLSDPVHRITIVSRGMSLGSTMQLPQIDKAQQTKTELESRLKVLLGGRAAEEIIFKDITGGASNDIEKATSIARKMVKLLGMSKSLGLIKYGDSNELQYLGYGYGEQRDYSDKTAELIDDEVRDLISHAYIEAKKILEDNIDILHSVAKKLLDVEVVEDTEFEEFFNGKKNLPDQKVPEE